MATTSTVLSFRRLPWRYPPLTWIATFVGERRQKDVVVQKSAQILLFKQPDTVPLPETKR